MRKHGPAISTSVLLSLLAVALLTFAGFVWWQSMQKTTPTAAPSSETSATTGNKSTPETPPRSEPITGPLTVYYIAIDDNGVSGEKIGCDDSVVAVQTTSITTKDVVRSSFGTLLTNHEKDYGQSGLYNALYQSRLSFESSSVKDDTVSVELSGSIVQGGTCDSPRIKAQLEETAKKAAKRDAVRITVNGKPLDDVLSSK